MIPLLISFILNITPVQSEIPAGAMKIYVSEESFSIDYQYNRNLFNNVDEFKLFIHEITAPTQDTVGMGTMRQ